MTDRLSETDVQATGASAMTKDDVEKLAARYADDRYSDTNPLTADALRALGRVIALRDTWARTHGLHPEQWARELGALCVRQLDAALSGDPARQEG